MASIFQLPRELYLMICFYLSPTDLSRLSRVSTYHYLAAQQPLFEDIHLTTYRSLVKLVSTLMKVPVVSQISAKQRLYWHKLSDAQLRERDIKHLDLLVDQEARITGADLSRCIGAISRKCAAAQISLTFNRVWTGFPKQLQNLTLPNVANITLHANQDKLGMNIWDLLLSGSTFPDLRTLYMSGLASSNLPSSMQDGWQLADDDLAQNEYSDALPSDYNGPFYTLRSVEKVALKYNSLLSPGVLRALFGSDIIPKRLTRLEIVNCPNIHPIADLEDLAVLLQRGLQLLQFLKLHTIMEWERLEDHEVEYVSTINDHPEHHLCNIVRELGQNIKALDLVLPFACDRVFKPVKIPKQTDTLELPTITREPFDMLPERLIADGYRYRRVVYHGVCRSRHGWDDMALLAASQADMISWDVWSTSDEKAVWFVSGCSSVEFSLNDALQRPEYAG